MKRKKQLCLFVSFLSVLLIYHSCFAQGEELDAFGNQGVLYSQDDLPLFSPESFRMPELVLPELVNVSDDVTPQTMEEALAALVVEKRRVLMLQDHILLLTGEMKKALQYIKQLSIRKTGPRQTYLVKDGECLWSIAGKDGIYEDPYKWLLLYHANRDQIRDPDLIFPNTVLMVPRLSEFQEVFSEE